MLTLKYQGKQRGPQYFFQIESSVNFLNKDLVIIAYNSSGFQENFSNINQQSLDALKYVVGTIFTSYSQSGYTMMAASFSNAEGAEENLFTHSNLTITLLKNTMEEPDKDGIRGGGYIALAHFHAAIEDSDRQKPSLEQKGVDPDLRECKFDTLTFEPLGGIVRLPAKRVVKKKRQYDNCEQKLLHIKPVECSAEDPFFFPTDVFDTDVVFVDLPQRS